MRNINTSALVRKADASLDYVALFDILLIALMFTLLGSRFIIAPGLSMESATMPTTSDTNGAITDAELSVLNAKSPTMLIYDGAIFNIDSFVAKMRKAKAPRANSVLLIKADKSVSAQAIIEIANAAKAGGFTKIQLAAKSASATK